MIDIEQIKKLRTATGASIAECKKALEKAKGDLNKAREILKTLGQDLAKKRLGRETSEGIIDSYIHNGKKVGVLLELTCESDSVARSEDFQKLSHELCLHIAASAAQEEDLMKQSWIKDHSRTIKDFIEEHMAKFGENITVKKFIRYEL